MRKITLINSNSDVIIITADDDDESYCDHDSEHIHLSDTTRRLVSEFFTAHEADEENWEIYHVGEEEASPGDFASYYY